MTVSLRISTDAARTLQVSCVGALQEQSPIQVQLARHGELAVTWIASFALSAPDWSCALSLEADDPLLLLEVASLTDGAGNALPAEQLLLEPPNGVGDWESGELACDERDLRRAGREAFFARPLMVPGSTVSDPRWSVVALASNVHLTANSRVPGVVIRLRDLNPRHHHAVLGNQSSRGSTALIQHALRSV